ncbi:MAG: Ig-like domain-containing protein [Kofleriaceae bacterium]
MRGHIVVFMCALAACGDNIQGFTPPVLAGLQLTTDEDTPVSTTVDATGGAGTLSLTATDPEHGGVTIEGLRITYTPEADYNGSDAFSVTVSDGAQTVTAQASVSITAVNDAPVAVADTFAAAEDVASMFAHSAVLENDTDVDDDPLTVTSVANPSVGTVTTTGTVITFTPPANFVGAATFEYTISDGTESASAVVTVNVGGENDPPVAVDDTATTTEDTAVVITNLLANDTDPEGQTLSVTLVGNAVNGTVTLTGNDATFTPDANFSGTGTFEYTVSDGADTDTGLVTVTVPAVNDPPIAADDTVTTAEDVAVQLTQATLVANDTDTEASALTVTAVGNPTNGTVVLAANVATFTPAANFNGTATFEYTVSDGTDTDIGLVTITITPVADAPVAVDDAATTLEDMAVTVTTTTLLANDSDPDGQTPTVTAVGNPQNGTVLRAGNDITFTPTANFSGIATFDYTISDGTLTDVGTVSITVTPADDTPVANDDAAGVPDDTALELAHTTLLANDVDPDGPALTISLVGSPVNGTVVLGATTVTFTPTIGHVGPASFVYTVTDGTVTDTATVSITVTAGPVCGDGNVATGEQCDDGDLDAGDGCTSTCQIESGWSCAGEPSACTAICGDGMSVGDEPCDDGDADETDGCTSACVVGAVCDVTEIPGGDRFAVDPETGHCFVSFDTQSTTFAGAQTACVASGGYLATVTSASEEIVMRGTQNPAENPWIGASEDGNDTDAVFDWVTDEPFSFTRYAPNEPDDDVGSGGLGDCLHLGNSAGQWADTNCLIDTFVVGRICELEPSSCGDSVLQAAIGEQCDDGNTVDGDGCSESCELEPLAIFTFTGATGAETTFTADAPLAPGLAALPVMSRGAGVVGSSNVDAFSANAWALAGAGIDLTDYFSFSVMPAAGVSMSLLALELDERRSGTGIRTWAIRSSLDSFASDLVVVSVPDDTATRVTRRIALPGAFLNQTMAVEFRIYGYDAEAPGGTWRLDNVEVYGFTTGP